MHKRKQERDTSYLLWREPEHNTEMTTPKLVMLIIVVIAIIGLVVFTLMNRPG